MTFSKFYLDVFLPEHQNKLNRMLHILGTLLGVVWLVFCVWIWTPWAILLFPVVHALPGIVGHRLFERNPQIGDARITRSDFPLWWFVVGNHKMTWDALVRLKF